MRLLTLEILFNAAAITQASVLSWPPTWNATDSRAVHQPIRRSPSLDSETSRTYENDGPGFWRFEWVKDFLHPGDRLARSSAPHYDCKDCDQRLTTASIQFLRENKITHVISLNQEASSQSIRDDLLRNKIAYTALPTVDFQAPTLEDLTKAYDAFKKHRGGTLVWCGYGHGRTGTMISALQILSNHDMPSGRKISHWEYKENHVETDDQIEVLDKLQKSLRKTSPPQHKQAGAHPLDGLKSQGEAAAASSSSSSSSSSSPGPRRDPSKLKTEVGGPSRLDPGKQQIPRPDTQSPKKFSGPDASASEKMAGVRRPGPPSTKNKEFDILVSHTGKPSMRGPKVMANSLSETSVTFTASEDIEWLALHEAIFTNATAIWKTEVHDEVSIALNQRKDTMVIKGHYVAGDSAMPVITNREP
ncbi:hypothetical protein CP532_2339 [Ophiocordyceps camponoti-leonardi (nom. inval.)]|nr:hypothetical protein CP532_2339 [Ophiocordyceps camponoti-leonardi (nom. inval.)]